MRHPNAHVRAPSCDTEPHPECTGGSSPGAQQAPNHTTEPQENPLAQPTNHESPEEAKSSHIGDRKPDTKREPPNPWIPELSVSHGKKAHGFLDCMVYHKALESISPLSPNERSLSAPAPPASPSQSLHGKPGTPKRKRLLSAPVHRQGKVTEHERSGPMRTPSLRVAPKGASALQSERARERTPTPQSAPKCTRPVTPNAPGWNTERASRSGRCHRSTTRNARVCEHQHHRARTVEHGPSPRTRRVGTHERASVRTPNAQVAPQVFSTSTSTSLFARTPRALPEQKGVPLCGRPRA